MGLVDAVKSCLSQYVTFSGRAPRSELWFFKLGVLIAAIIAEIIDKVVLGVMPGVFYAIVVFGSFLPSLSVDVRRLHDLGKSGWAWWIALIPLAGIIILIVWFCSKGNEGDNRFGPDPLA